MGSTLLEDVVELAMGGGGGFGMPGARAHDRAAADIAEGYVTSQV